MRRLRAWVAVPILGLCAGGLALAEAPGNPWHAVKSPSQGDARSIGDYSAGCIGGAKALPLEGEGYVVVHPSRARYFGHPDLLDFIRKLGAQLHASGAPPMLVGDLGQARGGPAPSGHASHQSGLDVDIWLWTPLKKPDDKLSPIERERVKGRSVLNARTRAVDAQYLARVTQLLHLAADDARVERMFVNPLIKRTLCSQASSDHAWLAKVRPWYGHDDHVHVRLACPEGSPECKPQAKAPAGDGCGELDWWFDEKAQADRERGKRDYQTKVMNKRVLPPQCKALLAEP